MWGDGEIGEEREGSSSKGKGLSRAYTDHPEYLHKRLLHQQNYHVPLCFNKLS